MGEKLHAFYWFFFVRFYPPDSLYIFSSFLLRLQERKAGFLRLSCIFEKLVYHFQSWLGKGRMGGWNYHDGGERQEQHRGFRYFFLAHREQISETRSPKEEKKRQRD